MPLLRPRASESGLAELLCEQAGAASRSQLLELGMTDEQIARNVRARQWHRSGLPGIYLTFTGPLPYLSRCWAALLYAGDGATLALESAAWLWKLRDDAPSGVAVAIPIARRVTAQPGVLILHRVHLAKRRHPTRNPPVTTVEDTVLDLVDTAEKDTAAVDVILRACQRRLTTTVRLLDSAERRKKMRRRALLLDVLTDVKLGVQSTLERRYFRDVEAAHGLPPGARNRAEGPTGRRRYRDVRYLDYGVVVELDGRATHPTEERDRDDIRDNELVEVEGTVTLRYGWLPVAGRACDTAGQLGRVLRSRGWRGTLTPCGPSCTAIPFP